MTSQLSIPQELSGAGRPTPSATVLMRGLALGVLFVGIAILLMFIVGLVGTAGLWVTSHFSWLEPDTIERLRSAMPQYLGFAAAGIGMWTGAYLVTPKGSVLATAAGLTMGGGFGVVLYGLGSPLWSLGMLGVGWAVATPAASLRTAAIRTLPSIALGFMTLGVEAESLLHKATLLVLGATIGAAIVVVMVTVIDPLVERRGQ